MSGIFTRRSCKFTVTCLEGSYATTVFSPPSLVPETILLPSTSAKRKFEHSDEPMSSSKRPRKESYIGKAPRPRLSLSWSERSHAYDTGSSQSSSSLRYICSVCPKRFNRSLDLRRHEASQYQPRKSHSTTWSPQNSTYTYPTTSLAKPSGTVILPHGPPDDLSVVVPMDSSL